MAQEVWQYWLGQNEMYFKSYSARVWCNGNVMPVCLFICQKKYYMLPYWSVYLYTCNKLILKVMVLHLNN